MELIDVTENKSIFKGVAINSEDGVGLDHVTHYSSKEGIPIYKDHEYELVSIYNNTSGEDRDAMAAMMLFVLDKERLYGDNWEFVNKYLNGKSARELQWL